MNMLIKIFGILMLTLAMSGKVFSSVENTTPINSHVNNTHHVASMGNPNIWHLTNHEWARYENLIRGEAGIYYQELTPPEVLGYYAETEIELRHFAEIYAKMEHAKIERELRFNNAFTLAAKELFRDEKPIAPFDISAYSPIPKRFDQADLHLKAGDRLVLFTDPVSGSTEVLSQLIQGIREHVGATLDIYLLNIADDRAIQAWARNNNIPVDLVSANRITLNKDHGLFSKINASGNLPDLLIVRAGSKQTIRVRLNP